jgi:hypothetical protein
VLPEWGIKFQCVEPGGFRTDWAGRSMDFPEEKIPEYGENYTKYEKISNSTDVEGWEG